MEVDQQSVVAEEVENKKGMDVKIGKNSVIPDLLYKEQLNGRKTRWN